MWTLAVFVGIYSTLGLTATLAERVSDEDLFVQAFIIAFFLMCAAVLTHGLKARLRGIEVGVGLGVAAVYLMVFARMGIAERTHLFEYMVLALFIHEALKERAKHGRHVPGTARFAFAATVLIGTLDECIQAFLPNHIFDIVDIGFNALAAFMSILASVVLGWVRKRTTQSSPEQPQP